MDTKDTSTEERLREQLCATVSEALAIRTERDELRENANAVAAAFQRLCIAIGAALAADEYEPARLRIIPELLRFEKVLNGKEADNG